MAACAASFGARPTIIVSRPPPHSRCAALFGVFQRHRIDDGILVFEIVDRQLVKLMLQ